MANYAKLAATAQRLIDKNGRDVLLTQKSEVPVDSNKPWRGMAAGMSNANETNLECKAVFKATEMAQGKDGVVRSFQIALISALSVTSADLSRFDMLTDGSVKWNIGRIDPVKPGPIDIIWKLYLSL